MSRYIFVKNLYRMLEDTSGINSNNEIIANINEVIIYAKYWRGK